jgi:hypothetical protein
MERAEITLSLKKYMVSFSKLPIYVQKSNSVTFQNIKQQYNAIKKFGIVNRNFKWAPQAIFTFKDEKKCKSIQEYFEKYGIQCENIVSIKPISVLDEKNNKYIPLYDTLENLK